MKKLLLVSFILVIVIGLILSGCTAAAPTTTEPGDDQPTTTTTEPIKLIFASYTSEKGFVSHGLKAFGEDLEAKTDGRVVVEYSWQQALGTIPEYYDVLVRGIADVVHFSPYQTTGVFPLSEVGTLPWVIPTADIGTEAFHQVYAKGLLDKKFYEGIKPLFVCNDQGSNVRTANTPLTTLDDCKGVKIMIPGGEIYSARAAAMGLVPVVVTGPEVYMAIQKGTVEGQITGWCPMLQFKWCEVNHYATEPLIGGSPWCVAMNIDTYNNLPKDIQQIVDEMADDPKYRHAAAVGLDDLNEASRDCFLEKGGTILEWEPSALAEMDEKFAPIFDKWISDNEAKGLNATELCNEYYKALENLGVSDPGVGYTPK